MFTGIIREIGVLNKIKNAAKNRLSLKIKTAKIKPHIGDSIAINGVCLTVTKKTKNGFEVDVVPETLNRTTLGSLEKGALLNLEPSLRLNDPMDGHFVTGHVDCVGKIAGVKNGILMIKFPKKFSRFLAEKGSVAINGVSLTIAKTAKNTLITALIPFTKRNTNLGSLRANDSVNIETDIIAKYLNRLCK